METSSPPPIGDLNLLVKRHTHDVRNALNGMEIEMILLDEFCSGNAEVHQAVGRLRQTVNELGKLVRGLSAKFGAEFPKLVPALQIAERWRNDARPLASVAELEWNIQLNDEVVWVDSNLIRSLLLEALELLVKSNSRRSVRIHCRTELEKVIFQIEYLEVCSESLPRFSPQQSYWNALRSVGRCADIGMLPEELEDIGMQPLRFELPIHCTES